MKIKRGKGIDVGAERLITAEQASQKIAIEIKSFLGTSVVKEFHLALVERQD